MDRKGMPTNILQRSTHYLLQEHSEHAEPWKRTSHPRRGWMSRHAAMECIRTDSRSSIIAGLVSPGEEFAQGDSIIEFYESILLRVSSEPAVVHLGLISPSIYIGAGPTYYHAPSTEDDLNPLQDEFSQE